jgi:hypothetical protein
MKHYKFTISQLRKLIKDDPTMRIHSDVDKDLALERYILNSLDDHECRCKG